MPEPSLTQRISMAPSDHTDALISAEWGINKKIPIYSGGLGFLAADQLKEAADRGLPLMGFGIFYDKGWVKQKLDERGFQIDGESSIDPEVFEQLGLSLAKIGQMPVLEKIVIDRISPREVSVGAYILPVEGKRATLPLFLGTTNIPENTNEWDRGLTAKLYDNGNGSRDYYRTIQWRILAAVTGIARQMGYAPRYQLNEGHGAFVILQMMNEGISDERIREQIWLATHTPEAAAFDYLAFSEVANALPNEAHRLLPYRVNYEGKDCLGMAELAIAFSRGINAVSKMHAEVSAQKPQFQGREIRYATNGVHLPTWVHPAKARLYEAQLKNPFENPEEFRRSEAIDDELFEQAHRQAQRELFELVKTRTKGYQLDEGQMTIGFARRGVPYKRADLLLGITEADMEALAKVINGNAQLVYASKAPPGDKDGRDMIQRVHQKAEELGRIYGSRVIFVPDYDMELGLALVRGVDLWLNNPMRGREACGTSGMKVIPNWGVNMSVLDGFWPEVYNGRNGFAIGPHNFSNDRDFDFRHALALLEFEAIPAYRDGRAWKQLRRESGKLAADLNTWRNLQDLRRIGAHTYDLEKVLSRDRRAA